MLIDTHTHVPNLTSVDKIIYSSGEKDIEKVFNVSQKNKNIFCTIGIHPEFTDINFNYESKLQNSKVVGVGEIGLDYHYGNENSDEQIKLFKHQLEIAKRANLPVAIHSREAEIDTKNILKEFDLIGVLHCFTSSYELARTMLDRGFYISASGIITFKNADALRETFAKIPMDRIVAETDSPFCSPVPFRGKEAKPAMVIEVIKCLADIKKISVMEMEEIVWQNSHKLYPKLMNS